MLSFCQVQILFLPFPIGVLDHLFNIFSSYQVFLLFSTGVLSKFCHSCSLAISVYRWGHILLVLEALISCLSTSWFSSYPLFLFSNGVFSTLFVFVVFFLSICSTSQGSWFHSFVKKQFVLPLPLLFLSGAILDLGTRSSCSGGVL